MRLFSKVIGSVGFDPNNSIIAPRGGEGSAILAKNSRAPFFMEARFSSNCMDCRRLIVQGDRIKYHPVIKKAECETCVAGGSGWIAELVEDVITALDEGYRQRVAAKGKS